MTETRAYLKPHEIKRVVDDAAHTLDVAVDTENMLWEVRATGQDTEEAETSGYMAGYRDALMAVQRIVNHGDASFLSQYVASLRDDEIPEWRREAEEIDPEYPFFWNT
jgi:hypothetical protein